MRSIVDEWLKVDRADCSSLINGLLDANSTLPFVLLETVRGRGKRCDAKRHDVMDAEPDQHSNERSFEALLKRCGLDNNLALVLFGKIAEFIFMTPDRPIERRPSTPPPRGERSISFRPQNGSGDRQTSRAAKESSDED